MGDINDFMLGLLVMGSTITGLFFLRFWKKSSDRLFMVFALAFWLLGLNWLLLAMLKQDEAQTPYLYLVRLAAFILIIWAIWDKNRVAARE